MLSSTAVDALSSKIASSHNRVRHLLGCASGPGRHFGPADLVGAHQLVVLVREGVTVPHVSPFAIELGNDPRDLPGKHDRGVLPAGVVGRWRCGITSKSRHGENTANPLDTVVLSLWSLFDEALE